MRVWIDTLLKTGIFFAPIHDSPSRQGHNVLVTTRTKRSERPFVVCASRTVLSENMAGHAIGKLLASAERIVQTCLD